MASLIIKYHSSSFIIIHNPTSLFFPFQSSFHLLIPPALLSSSCLFGWLVGWLVVWLLACLLVCLFVCLAAVCLNYLLLLLVLLFMLLLLLLLLLRWFLVVVIGG
jgi:hypothetical protein